MTLGDRYKNRKKSENIKRESRMILQFQSMEKIVKIITANLN